MDRSSNTEGTAEVRFEQISEQLLQLSRLPASQLAEISELPPFNINPPSPPQSPPLLEFSSPPQAQLPRIELEEYSSPVQTQFSFDPPSRLQSSPELSELEELSSPEQARLPLANFSENSQTQSQASNRTQSVRRAPALSISTLPKISKGQTYSSIDNAIHAARVHATAGRFSYKVKNRNKTRAYLYCKGFECPAYICIRVAKKTDAVTVMQLKDTHTCQGTLQQMRGSQRDHKFLVASVAESLAVTKNTKPLDVQAYLKHGLGIEVPYATAHKAREAILNESSDAQRKQFKMVRGYAQKLVAADPTTMAKVKTQMDPFGGDSRRFHSIFVAPGAARNAFLSMRKFVAIDGTFTKNRFICYSVKFLNYKKRM